MSLTNSPIWFGSGATGGGFYDYEINDSLRFNDDDSAYLNRTPSSAQTNTDKITISVWVKRANISNNRSTIMFAKSGSAGRIAFESDNTILANAFDTGYNGFRSSAVFRDPSAWYHIVYQGDSTLATAADRNRLWVNGVEQVNSLSSSFTPQNQDTLLLRNGIVNYIGRDTDSTAYNFDGYMSDMNVIDGAIVDPTSFGETKSGVWIPKSYGGSYGTNGFHLDFSNNSTATNLGLDSSGNSNNWSVNNIATTDQMIDTPTNNFATFNPLMYRWVSNTTTLSEGNLKSTGSSGYAFGTMNIPASGKWYFETYTVAGTSVGTVGVGDGILLQNSSVSDVVYYFSNGNKSVNGTVTSYGATWTTGDVIGVACDADSGTVTFYKNGSSQGSISYDPSEKTVFFGNWGTTGYFVLNHGQDSTFAGNTTAGGNSDANGVGDFKYAPPSGFLALCSANLPEPTIVDGSEHFNTVLWSGDSVDNRDITGIGFDADLTWFKARSNTNSNGLFDTVRGNSNPNGLSSNSISAEFDWTGIFKGHITDGFTVGTDSAVNQSGQTYVAWNWKAGGTAVSNTDGSITSQVSAGEYMSICTWTGNGTSGATIGHGLNKIPSMLIVKRRNTANGWPVYHEALGTGSEVYLNYTQATTSSNFWITSPTSSVFSVSNSDYVNTSSDTYVGYAFANLDGACKVGSYIGNGSTNGPFVYTGFRPSFILTKESSSTSGWNLRDNKRSPENVVNEALQANTAGVELTSGYDVDFLSNGFKLRTSLSDSNTSGQTYIYLAFAENPFKYANAR